MPARGTLIRLVFLALGVGLLVWLVVRLGAGEILAMLGRIRWSFLVVLVLYAGHQAARALALILCVPARHTLGYRDALAIRLSGEAVQYLTFSGPILSEPAKALLLRRHGLTTWQGLAATLGEYLASSLTSALMAIAGLGYVMLALEPRGPVRVAALVVLVSMAVFVAAFAVGIAARLHIIGTVVRLVARVPGLRRRLGNRIGGLPEAEDLLIATLRSPERLARILGTEGLAHLCLGLELWALLAALAAPVGAGRVMLIEGATKFMSAAYSFVPGQVGVAEGTYAIIFSVFGLSLAAGFTVSFVRRIRSVITAGLGLAVMSILTRPSRQAG
jgi:uncharacterized membrane protein YbhN (UPF0104 family)